MRARVWTDVRLEAGARELLADYELHDGGDLASLPGCAAAIVSALVAAGAGFMDLAGPGLLAVARPGIGYDNVDVGAATARGVLVINTPDGPTESTAEHAIALLLSLAKQVCAADRRLRSGSWHSARIQGVELRGRTLGLVGLGRIGRRVAEIAGRGLLMRVVAYDPHAPAAVFREAGAERAASLDELLAQADALSLHCALTEETRTLIGARELGLLPRGAFLINCSRGPVVDEAALTAALASGQLSGAGLDVFAVEPLDPASPLLALGQVVVTPHMASYTDAGTRAMHRGVAAQVAQLLRGERPPHVVNPAAWRD